MNKTIKLPDNRVVTVVSPENAAAAISPSDAEMDYRAREAVKAAIHKAKVCKKPIAKYDVVTKRAYIETADGEKIYVGPKTICSKP